MNDWRFKRSLIAASVFCVLSGSAAQAQQAAPGDVEALKKMMQEVLKQNEELRKRVRDLENAVGKQPAAAPKEAVGEAPRDPSQSVAVEPPPGPLKTAREKIQLGGALEVEAGTRKDFDRLRSSDFALTTAEFDFEADVVDWAKAELSLQWDSANDKITVNEGLITIAKPTVLPVYLKTGRGVVPFDPYLREIKALGIDGAISIELEYSPEPAKIAEWVTEAYEATDRLLQKAGLRG